MLDVVFVSIFLYMYAPYGFLEYILRIVDDIALVCTFVTDSPNYD